MECFDISNISTTHVVASMVCFRNGVPDKDNYRRYRIRTVEGQDDFASMAEVVRRRYSRVLLEARAVNPDARNFRRKIQWKRWSGCDRFSQRESTNGAHRSHGSRIDSRVPRLVGMTGTSVRLPDLIIVDGGKGQLSSACRELQRLGLARVADHRPGQRIRRNLSAGPRAAVAVAAGFRRVAFASAHPR